MSNFYTPYMIELIAKGHVAINEHEPTQVKEENLIRLLSDIIERVQTVNENQLVEHANSNHSTGNQHGND